MSTILENYEELTLDQSNGEPRDILDIYQYENDETVLIWGDGFVKKVSDKTFDEVTTELKKFGYVTTFKKPAPAQP